MIGAIRTLRAIDRELYRRKARRRRRPDPAGKFIWEEGDIIVERAKGSAASGNWLHTSFNRMGVGRGGSDPAGAGGSLGKLDLPPDSTIDERREASARLRQEWDKKPEKKLGTPDELRKRIDKARVFPEGPYNDEAKEVRSAWGHEHFDALFYDFGGAEKGKPMEAGIGDYCGAGYRDVNNVLREKVGPDSPDTDFWWSKGYDDVQNKIGFMDQVMADPRARVPEDVVAWRSFGTSMIDTIQALQVGDTFTDKAFVSTTIDRAFKYGGVQGAKDRARILIPKGTRGMYVGVQGWGSFITRESELLLDRGARFMVIGKDPDGQPILSVIEQGVKALGGKGSAASGNWGHTSFQRMGVGRGGSDPSVTGGGGLAVLSLDEESSVEERREASQRVRSRRERGETDDEKGLKAEIREVKDYMASATEAERAGLQSYLDTLQQSLASEQGMNDALWEFAGARPENATRADWELAADGLEKRSYDLYQTLTKPGIQMRVEELRGAKDSGYMVVGGKQIMVKKGAFSVRTAARMRGQMWAEAKETLMDHQGRLLRQVGFTANEIQHASFFQRARLLSELGSMTMTKTGKGRTTRIDRVPVDARARTLLTILPDLATTCLDGGNDPLALPSLGAYQVMQWMDTIRSVKLGMPSFESAVEPLEF